MLGEARRDAAAELQDVARCIQDSGKQCVISASALFSLSLPSHAATLQDAAGRA
jgi:hypothetical protein